MNPISTCPTLAQWEEFLHQGLSSEQTEPLARHLEHCEACAELLQQVQFDDTLSEQMRQHDTMAAPAFDPLVASLVERFACLANQDRTGVSDSTSEDEPNPELTAPAVPASPDASATVSFLAPPQQSDEIGRLGNYRVLKIIGGGGMGMVLQAEDPRLQRLVALKVMHPDMASKPGARERFLREARATAAIEHNHIIHIYAVDEDRGVPYLAMPLLKGMPLDQLLARGKPRKLEHILRIVREIALGLDAAHRRGLIHRDIKPGNIWIESEAGRVKILDFGLALPTGEQSHLTQSGMIVGTPNFMSPEQAAGGQIDARSDLFSLGCILYRMCAGVPPFRGRDIMAILTALAVETPRLLREFNTRVPAELEALTAQLLEKEPKRRPASARDVAQAIRKIEKQLAAEAEGTTALLNAAAAPVVEPMNELPARLDPFEGIDNDLSSEPAVPKAASGKPKKLPWIAIGLALLLLSAGVAAIVVMKVESPNGTLIVEIEGDDVETRVKGKKLTITDKKANRTYDLTIEGQTNPMNLPTGEYEIAVSDDSGLKLRTKEFAIARNDKTAVRVTMTPKVAARPAKDKVLEELAKTRFPFSAERAKSLQERWADALGVKMELTNSLGMKFRLIPAGEFDLAPNYHVIISKPYYLGVHEVTVAQFREFVKDTAYRTSAERNPDGGASRIDGDWAHKPEFTWKHKGVSQGDNYPIGQLSWNDAVEFCNWLSKKEHKTYRLPTEAEWEWACRAGNAAKYHFGDDANLLREYAWFSDNSEGRSHPVGEKKPNAWGLFDMHGNASEYVIDWMGPRPTGKVIDPRGPQEGVHRMVRSYAYFDPADALGADNQGAYGQDGSMCHFGLRALCEVSPAADGSGEAPNKSAESKAK